MLRTVFKIFFGAALLALIHALPVYADDVLLKPFILATTPAGNMEAVVATVKTTLIAQGFEEAGSYSPYSGATIIIVSSPELKAVAAKSELGGFGAAFLPVSGPGVIPFASESASGMPKHRQLTQELRVESPTQGPLAWQAGVYWFNEDYRVESFSYDDATRTVTLGFSSLREGSSRRSQERGGGEAAERSH